MLRILPLININDNHNDAIKNSGLETSDGSSVRRSHSFFEFLNFDIFLKKTNMLSQI